MLPSNSFYNKQREGLELIGLEPTPTVANLPVGSFRAPSLTDGSVLLPFPLYSVGVRYGSRFKIEFILMYWIYKKISWS